MTQTIPPPGEDAPTGVLGAPPPGGEPPPSRRLGWGLALGLLVLVAVAGAAAAAYFATRGNGSKSAATTSVPVATTTAPATTALVPPGRVIVPDVTGLKEATAAARLGAVHLTPKVVTKATKKPNGTVVGQTPVAGKQARKNSLVTIVVDQGQPAVALPDLTGLKVAAAGTRLAKLGLKAKTTNVTARGKPAGTVVDEAPAAGTKLKPGSVVTLSVARTPAGAKTTSTATTTTTVAATTTAAQPKTTTSAAPSHPSTATVPNVTGQLLADAADALAGAGVYPNVVYIPGSDPIGTVEQQAKSAGTTVPWGSYVRINVSKGPNPAPDTQVPDVTQKTRTQAMQTLSNAGFQTKVEWKPVAPNVPNDVVLDEQPSSTAPRGALVILLVAKQSR